MEGFKNITVTERKITLDSEIVDESKLYDAIANSVEIIYEKRLCEKEERTFTLQEATNLYECGFIMGGVETLRNLDEIESFYLEATGDKPKKDLQETMKKIVNDFNETEKEGRKEIERMDIPKEAKEKMLKLYTVMMKSQLNEIKQKFEEAM